jgi:hypothetical protein
MRALLSPPPAPLCCAWFKEMLRAQRLRTLEHIRKVPLILRELTHYSLQLEERMVVPIHAGLRLVETSQQHHHASLDGLQASCKTHFEQTAITTFDAVILYMFLFACSSCVVSIHGLRVTCVHVESTRHY